MCVLHGYICFTVVAKRRLLGNLIRMTGKNLGTAPRSWESNVANKMFLEMSEVDDK